MQQAGGLASVKNVQVRTSGATGGFQSLTNKWGSDWETPNAPAFPLDINIVGADGEAVSCAVKSSSVVMHCLPSGGNYSLSSWHARASSDSHD